MNILIKDLTCLNNLQKNLLQKGGFITVGDLLLPPPNEVARRVKINTSDVEAMIESVSTSVAPQPKRLDTFDEEEIFTTGDEGLDSLLNGGIRVGIITEVVGEGASGKSQLAMQLALTVQLPLEFGGLNGSTVYLTAGSSLATPRLQQLIERHPRFSPDLCDLDRIQTTDLPIPKALTFYLRQTIPTMIAQLSASPTPIKLIVIDSLAALFRSTGKTTSALLFERSKSLHEVSYLLHGLAADHGLAVVVVNDVTDVFTNDHPIPSNPPDQNELVYKEQARWFNRPASLNDRKEAGLGLVWANQINARIFLTRTGRRKAMSSQVGQATGQIDDGRDAKRQRTEIGMVGTQNSEGGSHAHITEPPTLVRRLDVIFSNFSAPRSIDFVITPSGFQTIRDSVQEVSDSPYFGGNVDVGVLDEDALPRSSLPSGSEEFIEDLIPDLLPEDAFIIDEVELLDA